MNNKRRSYARNLINYALTLLILPAAVGYLLFHLGVFTVREVLVEGNFHLGEREILKRSGLRVEESDILFFKSSVEKSILQNPFIKSVVIEKDIPSRVVRIKIEEEKPYCVALDDEGELHYLNHRGKRIGHGRLKLGLDFPILTGNGIKDPKMLSDALRILDLSSKSNILTWNEISQVEVDALYGVRVWITGKRYIDFGLIDLNGGDIVKKWRRIEKIIDHARDLGVRESYINVSSDKIGVVQFES